MGQGGREAQGAADPQKTKKNMGWANFSQNDLVTLLDTPKHFFPVPDSTF
jgi:hypothetical protein